VVSKKNSEFFLSDFIKENPKSLLSPFNNSVKIFLATNQAGDRKNVFYITQQKSLIHLFW